MYRKVKLNWFKIKDNIPQEVKIYKSLDPELIVNPNAIYRIAGRNYGIVYDKENFTYATLIETNDELIDILNIDKFPKGDQKQLVQYYIKSKYYTNISGCFYKKKHYMDNITIREAPAWDVEIINGSVYLVMNIKHEIFSNKSLWDLVGRNSKKLHIYIEKMVKSIISNKSFILSNIKKSDQKVIKQIYNYHIKKYGSEALNRALNMFSNGHLDYNQPIVIIIPLGKEDHEYISIPQLLTPIYRSEDLGEDFRMHIKERFDKIGEKVENLNFVDKTPIEVEYKKLRDPILYAKNYVNEKIRLKNLNEYFNTTNNRPKYLPIDIPRYLMKMHNIETIILYDKKIKNVNDKLDKLEKLIKIWNWRAKFTEIPEMQLIDHIGFEFIEHVIRDVRDIIKKRPSFAWIISKEKYPIHQYELLRQRLLNMEIISQNILLETLSNEKGWRAIRNTILLDIHAKFGIKPYSIKLSGDYDFILGIDTTKSKLSNAYLGGTIVVIDSVGSVKKIMPVKSEQPGEKINPARILYKVIDKGYINIEDKKLMVLRDGKIYKEEIEEMRAISEDENSKITYISIRKRHPHIIYTMEKGIAVITNDMGLLIPHGVRKGTPRPLKITQKFIITPRECLAARISLNDMQLMYELTKINYSTLYGDIKLPAPLHYANGFVGALRRGWELKEKYLREGALYFI